MTIRISSILCAVVALAIVILVCSHNVAFSSDIPSNTSLSQKQSPEVKTTSSDSETHPVPNIEFTTSQHDFGNVSAGAKPTTEFLFKNTGDATLIIKEVKGG